MKSVVTCSITLFFMLGLPTHSQARKVQATELAVKSGLKASYFVASKGDPDGLFEEQVCLDLEESQARLVKFGIDGIQIIFPSEGTPCDEVSPGEKWMVRYEGLMKVENGLDQKDRFSVDIDADVNDGLRFIIHKKQREGRAKKKNQIFCEIEMWSQVPSGWNYHSTDAYDPELGCDMEIKDGKEYAVTLELFHQSELDNRNPIHNRPYLDLWFRGLRNVEDPEQSGKISFYHRVPNLVEVPQFRFVDGLDRFHYADGQEVCLDLHHAWHDDNNLDIRDRSFGFRYQEGTTPCSEITPFSYWQTRLKGYFTVVTENNASEMIDIEFAADVNDGLRFSLFQDKAATQLLCGLDFWKDVPEFDNYHSTDANGLRCLATIKSGVHYPVDIEVYHHSNPQASNYIFNRGYLDLFLWGLPPGASIKFVRLERN